MLAPATLALDGALTDVDDPATRTAHDRGAAGVRFGSNLDDRPCFAVFEARHP
ncbi:MAG TPA: hypothetical protein VK501_27205 [Baekduia sp.]|uniref:hypothetical protein n=1 Tax=Baekduia sp. TaxID=2600305 RepID=UPI002C0EF677|nr:hypothetical protein [Baekduia sp.]HMJ37624.1 hypothetical protein [Baekduia sp.]